jgi:hypothetical protein
MGQHSNGGKLGARVSVVVSDALVSTHSKLLHIRRKLAMLIFREISDEISKEVDDTIGPFLRKMAQDYDENGPAQAMLNFMGYGHGQWKAIVGSSVSASGLLWALGTVMNNELAPVVYNYVQANPHLIPDPSTIAGLAATSRWDTEAAKFHITQSGFNRDWATQMIDAQRTYPGVADALDFLHKGQISEDQFRFYVMRNGYTDEAVHYFLASRFQPLSPEEAALAELRGNLTHEKAAAQAAQSGVDEATFDVMVGNTGEPPGLEQLNEAFRRKFIDEARLRKGIAQSRVRNEWADTIVAMRYVPMSTADAVRAVVQSQISAEQGREIAEQNGLEPGQFDILYKTDGNPISPHEAFELYNRGQMTEATVKQALRESRIKNKYVDDIFKLHQKLLEPRQLSDALHTGSITHAEALRLAMDAGYSEKDAAIIVETASRRKLAAARDRVISAAETLYMDNAYSRDEFSRVVRAMGYDQSEADVLVQSAEFHREARAFSAALNMVRNKYIGHHIGEHEAQQSMAQIGVPAEQQDYLIKLWHVEKAANTRSLTPTQVLKAGSLGLITPDEVVAKLVDLGYSPEDASLLMEGA